jgi:hypothetical protein
MPKQHSIKQTINKASECNRKQLINNIQKTVFQVLRLIIIIIIIVVVIIIVDDGVALRKQIILWAVILAQR